MNAKLREAKRAVRISEKDEKELDLIVPEEKTKEVVINKCFGGFCISNDALIVLINRKAKCVEKKLDKDYYGLNNKKLLGSLEKRIQDYKEDKKKRKLFKDGFYHDGRLSTGPFIEGLLFKGKYVYCLKWRDEIREDKDLISVVKEMKEKVNGKCAQLEIVEIPNNVEYEISDYDGVESIHEIHRTWG